MSTSVSVVIPACNSARFIRQTLESVFAQTRLPDEIVVVDDASRDGTLAIVRALAAESPAPLRLVELPRNTGGPAKPMNVGIEAARGEWIAMLDHDDLLLPDKLAAALSAAHGNPDSDLVMGDYESFSSERVLASTDARSVGGPWCALLLPGPGPVHRVSIHDALSAFLRVPGLARGCSNMFFRKSFWERAGGFDMTMGANADYEFLLRAIDRPIVWIDEKMFCRREHEQNLWKPTKVNTLATIRAQVNCAKRFLHAEQLQEIVRQKVGDVARVLRWRRHYTASLQAACMLATAGAARPAIREMIKTVAAVPRDMLRGKRSASIANNSPEGNADDRRLLRHDGM